MTLAENEVVVELWGGPADGDFVVLNTTELPDDEMYDIKYENLYMYVKEPGINRLRYKRDLYTNELELDVFDEHAPNESIFED